MSNRRVLHIFLTPVIFAAALLFSLKTNISAAISCPTGLTQQCAAPVTYTKDVVSNSSFQTSPTNVCFEYVQPGDVLRTDTYVSHVYYNCRNGNTRDENGEVITVCDFTTTCQIAPVCTCVGSAPTSCTKKVSFANKNLEVRESTATTASELYTYNMDTLAYGNVDIRTGASESYDVYKSDQDGNPTVNGEYLTIFETRDYIGEDNGNNIDSAVLVDRTTGARYPATTVVSSMRGASQPEGSNVMEYNALGEPDGKYTYMGDLRSRITLGFSFENCQPTPSPVVTAAPSGQCVNTKIYTNSWVELTPEAFKGLSSGIQVYFCVNGVTNTNVFDAGRFTINGVTRTQTTVKRPNTNDFCDLYTIPANTYNFKVQGELHHTILGWL